MRVTAVRAGGKCGAFRRHLIRPIERPATIAVPMRRVLAHVLAVLIAVVAQAQQDIHPDELKLKPDIDKAIARGVEALINSQFRDGTWGQYGNFRGGKTALCTYALLKCGVDAAHPTIRRAMLMLDDVQPANTYTVACMMLAYAAAGQTMLPSVSVPTAAVARLADTATALPLLEPQGVWLSRYGLRV